MRELSDAQVHSEAKQLAAYLAKPGNRGRTFWFDSKPFLPGDRGAIALAFADLDEDEAP